MSKASNRNMGMKQRWQRSHKTASNSVVSPRKGSDIVIKETVVEDDFVGNLLFKYAVAPDIDNPVGTGPDQTNTLTKKKEV